MNKPKNGAKSFEKNYIYLPMIHRKSCDDEITNLYTQKTNKITRNYLDGIIESDKLIARLRKKLSNDKKDIVSRLIIENKSIPCVWRNKPDYNNMLQKAFENDYVMSRFTSHVKNAIQRRKYYDQLAIEKEKKKEIESDNEYQEHNDNNFAIERIAKNSGRREMMHKNNSYVKYSKKHLSDWNDLSGISKLKKELLNKSSVYYKNDNSFLMTLRDFRTNKNYKIKKINNKSIKNSVSMLLINKDSLFDRGK